MQLQHPLAFWSGTLQVFPHPGAGKILKDATYKKRLYKVRWVDIVFWNWYCVVQFWKTHTCLTVTSGVYEVMGKTHSFLGNNVKWGNELKLCPCSPLGCILNHWDKFGGELLTKWKLKEYCTQWWPKYKLDGDEKWTEMGTLNYNNMLQLLFCRRLDKWDEVMCMDLFFSLRSGHKTRKKCRLLVSDSNVLMMVEEKKKLSCCCTACSRGKRCLKVDSEEECVQLLVSLRKYQDSDNWDQESTDGQTEGNNAFCPIAGRIWALQKPVYVQIPFWNQPLI